MKLEKSEGTNQVFVILHPDHPEQRPRHCGVWRENQIDDLLVDFKFIIISLQLDYETVISGAH